MATVDRPVNTSSCETSCCFGGSSPGLLLFAAVHREHGVLAVVRSVQRAQGVHVLIGDRKIDPCVGAHMIGIRGLWQRYGAHLQRVADTQLWHSHTVLRGYSCNFRVFQYRAVSYGGVSLLYNVLVLKVGGEVNR